MEEPVKMWTPDHNPGDVDWVAFDAGSGPGAHVEKAWLRQRLLGGIGLAGYGQPQAYHARTSKSSEDFLSNPVFWESFPLAWPQFL